MKKKPVYILSAAALGPCGDIQQTERKVLAADPEPTDIEDTLMTLTGLDLRRVGHFSELALVGSALALKRLKTAHNPNAAVYFGTGLGEVQKTMALFRQTLGGEGGAASPYSFINSVSSTTGFYIARTSGLESRNFTVCQEEFSFEWALKLACDAIIDGDVVSALAGGADESARPREEHLIRLPLEDWQIMGEGGGWLYLSPDPESAIGEVLEVRELVFDEKTDALQWAAAVSGVLKPYATKGQATLLPGFRLDMERVNALVKSLPGGCSPPCVSIRRYLDYCGCFHTAAAFGIASAFDMPHQASRLYFHVNSNTEGRTMAVIFRAYGEK